MDGGRLNLLIACGREDGESEERVQHSAQSTGYATNPLEEFKIRKTTLQFYARNAYFSDNDHL